MVKISKVFEKALLGFLTCLTASVAAKPEIVLHFSADPKRAIPLIVGSLIAGILVGVTNYLKHRKDK